RYPRHVEPTLLRRWVRQLDFGETQLRLAVEPQIAEHPGLLFRDSERGARELHELARLAAAPHDLRKIRLIHAELAEPADRGCRARRNGPHRRCVAGTEIDSGAISGCKHRWRGR